MSVETTDSLRITRVIRADRQAVWDAFTQPEHMRGWMCPAPNGAKAVTADVRVGGEYTIQMVVEGEEHNAFGTYREIDPPSRLVYTWDWRDGAMSSMGDTVVTVEFKEVDGGTEVVLVHEGFPTPEAKSGHEQGWGGCFMNLEAMFA